jgi:hypothetical protein
MNWTFKTSAITTRPVEDGLAASRHLTHQQICDLLLATPSGDPDTGAELKQEAHQQHVDACLICASELSLLRTSVTGFRDVSTAIADRALARQTRSRLLPVERNAGTLTPAFFWAATGILFAAVLPLSLFHQNLNPFLKQHTAAPVVASSSPTPAKTLEAEAVSDEALLEGINQDLSSSIPSAMLPLAGSVADSSMAASSSSYSPYLKNEKE